MFLSASDMDEYNSKRTVRARFCEYAYATPRSHSFELSMGLNSNLGGIGFFKFGLNGEGGFVFKEKSYKARCAATAGRTV